MVLSLEAEGRDELTLEGVQTRARVRRGFARKIAHDLVAKGWLQRVGRGRYLLAPSRFGPGRTPDTDPLRFGARVVLPYYFAFATAAELHGLLPQASRVYYLASTRRTGTRFVHAAQFRVVTMRPSRFFGTRRLARRGEELVVSDRERTVLDCLSRPEFSGGLGGVLQVLSSAAGRLDWGRMQAYLDRLGRRSLALRLGYLLELLPVRARPPRRWLDRLAARRREPYVPLGRPKEFGRRGPRDRRWHVIENVPKAVLRAEVDLR